MVREIATGAPKAAWHRVSAGMGTKGPRWYDWMVHPFNSPEPDLFSRWLLVRRSISDPTEFAYYLCGGRPDTSPHELVRVAGTRWAIEESFEAAKGEVGLDHYEVRSWQGWYRHITLSMFALAVLAVIRMKAAQMLTPAEPPSKKRSRSSR